MINGIRKVRLGVDIYDKRILDSCKFISDTVLQNRAIFSLQPAEYKPVSKSMVHNILEFCVSIIIVSGKREGDDRDRETFLLWAQ